MIAQSALRIFVVIYLGLSTDKSIPCALEAVTVRAHRLAREGSHLQHELQQLQGLPFLPVLIDEQIKELLRVPSNVLSHASEPGLHIGPEVRRDDIQSTTSRLRRNGAPSPLHISFEVQDVVALEPCDGPLVLHEVAHWELFLLDLIILTHTGWLWWLIKKVNPQNTTVIKITPRYNYILPY